MLVKSTVYQIFYRLLKEKFIRDEIKDKKKLNEMGDNSPKIWEERNEDKEYKAVVLFGGGRTADPKYFHRKSSELHPKHKRNGELDSLSFFKGLVYIEVTPPETEVKFDKKDTKAKADILYTQFQIKYHDEIEEMDKQYPEPTPLSKDTLAGLPNISDSTTDYPEALSSHFTAAKYTVQRFYENIATSNLEDAWALLSLDIQKKRWQGEFEKFSKGYTNTNVLRNIVVFNVSQAVTNIIDCRVFYDDEVSAYTTKELSSLDSMTVGDIDAFVENVKKMKSDFESKGLKNFDRIALGKLFDATASEHIWYTCAFDYTRLDELFTSQKAIRVKRVYDCSCIYIDGKWFINSIQAMKTVSAR